MDVDAYKKDRPSPTDTPHIGPVLISRSLDPLLAVSASNNTPLIDLRNELPRLCLHGTNNV